MKTKYIVLSTLLLASIVTTTYKDKENIVLANSSYVVSTNGCSSGSLPTYLDLNRCNEDEIREYYSSINELDDSKKSGTQVLQYLKPILYEMNYFTYNQVGNIYAITDRDWVNSPTLASGVYDSTTNTVSSFSTSQEVSSNPYITMLYVDYSIQQTTPLKDSKGYNNFDKEHVWCQSRGFKAPSGAEGPAGTDLHHLIAGDSYVNQQIHNNNPYGFVKVSDKCGDLTYTANNKRGTVLHTSTKDEATVVFEPADEWKGDIARSIFYMMARYNNIANKTKVISKYEPNLEIVNYATSNGAAIPSDDSETATIGILSDLLAWNKLDPVSDYEIYRNDLIYRNYQGNRNPFIDFPQWIDAIWGTANEDGTNYSSTTVGILNPEIDAINGISNEPLKVSQASITLNEGETSTIKAYSTLANSITWEVNDSTIASISKTSSASEEEITINAIKEGQTTLKASIKVDETEYLKTITITINKKDIIDDDDDDEEEIDLESLLMDVAIGIAVLIFFAIMYSTSKKKKSKKKKSSNKSNKNKKTKTQK